MWDWNFSYVIPSLLILTILLGYYFALPRLPVRMNRTYLAIMINEATVIILDLLSSIADNHYFELPIWLLVFLNSAFFFLFILRIYFIFVFTVTLLRIDLEKQRGWGFIVELPCLINLVIAVIGSLNGSLFSIDNENGYQKGPLYFTIYISYYFYIFYSFYLLYKYKDRVRRKREKISILFYNLILFNVFFTPVGYFKFITYFILYYSLYFFAILFY